MPEGRVGAPRTASRIPLHKSFQKPVTDAARGARRLIEVCGDDRTTRNRGLLAGMYLGQLRIAHGQIGRMIAFLEGDTAPPRE